MESTVVKSHTKNCKFFFFRSDLHWWRDLKRLVDRVGEGRVGRERYSLEFGLRCVVVRVSKERPGRTRVLGLRRGWRRRWVKNPLCTGSLWRYTPRNGRVSGKERRAWRVVRVAVVVWERVDGSASLYRQEYPGWSRLVFVVLDWAGLRATRRSIRRWARGWRRRGLPVVEEAGLVGLGPVVKITRRRRRWRNSISLQKKSSSFGGVGARVRVSCLGACTCSVSCRCRTVGVHCRSWVTGAVLWAFLFLALLCSVSGVLVHVNRVCYLIDTGSVFFNFLN